MSEWGREMNQELISLTRLIRVLEASRQPKAEDRKDAEEALEQLRRLCRYEIGEKILAKKDARRNTWCKGVVVAYMLHPPHFVVGKGDDRDELPKNAPLFGMDAKDIRPRDGKPEGGKIVKWWAGG